MAMDKGGEYSMEAMGPYADHGSPRVETKGDQDEIDLAIFGKRPQLKVCLLLERANLLC